MSNYAEYCTKDRALLDKYSLLTDAIVKKGERLPKKHGAWHRVRTFDNNWLVYDTWNGCVYLYRNGAEPSSTDNLYRVVYVFYDMDGKVENYYAVKPHMADFWRGHIN